MNILFQKFLDLNQKFCIFYNYFNPKSGIQAIHILKRYFVATSQWTDSVIRTLHPLVE